MKDAGYLSGMNTTDSRVAKRIAHLESTIRWAVADAFKATNDAHARKCLGWAKAAETHLNRLRAKHG